MSIDDTSLQQKPESKVRLAALVSAAVAVTIGLMAFWVWLSPYHMPSGSMLPTISPGEVFFIYKWAYRSSPIRRGDLIVFNSPGKRENQYLKRVIGIGGDHLSIKGQSVEVNGKPLRAADAPGTPFEYSDVTVADGTEVRISASKLDEQVDQVRYQVLQNVPPFFARELSIDVRAGEIYVLGDNRDNSLDSRFFGPVPVSSVEGHVVLRLGTLWQP